MKKKVTICLIILLVPLIFAFIFLGYLSLEEIRKNNSLEQEIKTYEEKINNTQNNNGELDEEIKSLTESNKNKIEEYEVWEELKNKIESILA